MHWVKRTSYYDWNYRSRRLPLRDGACYSFVSSRKLYTVARGRFKVAPYVHKPDASHTKPQSRGKNETSYQQQDNKGGHGSSRVCPRSRLHSRRRCVPMSTSLRAKYPESKFPNNGNFERSMRITSFDRQPHMQHRGGKRGSRTSLP